MSAERSILGFSKKLSMKMKVFCFIFYPNTGAWELLPSSLCQFLPMLEIPEGSCNPAYFLPCIVSVSSLYRTWSRKQSTCFFCVSVPTTKALFTHDRP